MKSSFQGQKMTEWLLIQSTIIVNSASSPNRFENNDGDGLVADGISFLTFDGASVIKNNRYGVKAIDSWVILSDTQTGGGGSIYNNTDKHVVAQGVSQVTAQQYWWGSDPPDSSMFDESVWSIIDYSNWLQFPNVLVAGSMTGARQSTPVPPQPGGNLLGQFMAEVERRGSRLAAAKALAAHPNEALARLAGYIELGEYIRMGLYVQAVETAQAWLEQQPSTKEMKYLYRGLFSAYFFLEEYRAAELAYKKLELLQDPLLVHFRGLLPEDDVIIESTDLRDKQAIEKAIAFTNYPNPFNPTSLIEYTLPAEAQVRIDVFNVMGQRVATLVNDRLRAGVHTATFDGSRLASGLYIARMQLNNQVYTRTMMLVK
ncbi:T9SS type A sorting domain-containing protein [Cyclonatronum proteinivorum]|uniref:T9SS type A sorting domain-containing protein n=1 Tax=Cyclonatronum proteinivorum TaxID=1457365 RepID=UPI000E0F711C|nr:T9SS type A sorting domain-containing protein [Cyclonatronum proteinivorum]